MPYVILNALAPCLTLAVLSLIVLAAIWKVRGRIKKFKLSCKDGLEIWFDKALMNNAP